MSDRGPPVVVRTPRFSLNRNRGTEEVRLLWDMLALCLVAKDYAGSHGARDDRRAGELVVALVSGSSGSTRPTCSTPRPRNNRSAVKSIGLD